MLKYLYVVALSVLTLSARNTMYPRTDQVPSCNRNFSGRDKVTFESPENLGDYGPHRMCNYLLTVASKGQISLTFTDAELIGVADLPLEYIVVFDGPDCMSRRTGAVFESKTATFVSTKNEMTALFISDKQIASKKFKASYTAVTGQIITERNSSGAKRSILDSCGKLLNGPSGTISFSGRGWKTALCIWKIEVQVGRKVHVHFTSLKLDPKYAWLRILDGDNCGAPLKRLIGNTEGVTPLNIISSSNTLTVILSSAYGTEEARLLAYYSDGSASEIMTSSPTPLTPEDLLTGTENIANNLAPVNTFDVLSNHTAYSIAGIILILLKLIAHL